MTCDGVVKPARVNFIIRDQRKIYGISRHRKTETTTNDRTQTLTILLPMYIKQAQTKL